MLNIDQICTSTPTSRPDGVYNLEKRFSLLVALTVALYVDATLSKLGFHRKVATVHTIPNKTSANKPGECCRQCRFVCISLACNTGTAKGSPARSLCLNSSGFFASTWNTVEGKSLAWHAQPRHLRIPTRSSFLTCSSGTLAPQ
jgi:hypothetical protein